VNQASRESAFDRMVEEIQRRIIEDERATYSQKILEETYNPKNLSRMSAPDAVGIVYGGCGDTMEIYHIAPICISPYNTISMKERNINNGTS